MTVTAMPACSSRNGPRGYGLAGGAWGNKHGWCERSPDGGAIAAHFHCRTCGLCLDGHRSDARYCTSACRQRAYRARNGGRGS